MVKLWQGISINDLQSLPQDYLVYCKRYIISVEATIIIGHGEVFLKESYPRILSKCLEDISDRVDCYLTKMSFARVLIGPSEKHKRSFRWSLVSVRQ